MLMQLRWIRLAGWFLFLLTFALLATAVVAIDPQSLNQVGLVLVFTLTYLWSGSGLFLALIALSRRFLGDERTIAFTGTALRQSGLIAGLATALLILQYFRLLTWWGALLALVLMLLIELSSRYFLSSSPKR